MAEHRFLLKTTMIAAAGLSGAEAQRLEPLPSEPRVEIIEASPVAPGAPDGDAAVHLASYHEAGAASDGWEVLTHRHPELARHQPLTSVIDLGERGVFVRLLAGPLAGWSDADELCETLRREGAYCVPATTAGVLTPHRGNAS